MKRLFIHIPKTGGMAIRHGMKGHYHLAALGDHITPEYSHRLKAVMDAAGEHHGAGHARWRDVRADWTETMAAFAVVRNPWARTVSRWTYFEIVCKQGKMSMPAGYTFRHFLDERHVYGGRPFYWHRAIRGWYPQADYVTDADGRLRCDVLRFEHYKADVMAYLGIDQPLRRRNISNQGTDWRSYYGSEETDIVAEWYAKDLEFFGFTFDGTAERNTWA